MIKIFLSKETVLYKWNSFIYFLEIAVSSKLMQIEIVDILREYQQF